MKVSKGRYPCHKWVRISALVVLYMILGRPLYYRVLIMTHFRCTCCRSFEVSPPNTLSGARVFSGSRNALKQRPGPQKNPLAFSFGLCTALWVKGEQQRGPLGVQVSFHKFSARGSLCKFLDATFDALSLCFVRLAWIRQRRELDQLKFHDCNIHVSSHITHRIQIQ